VIHCYCCYRSTKNSWRSATHRGNEESTYAMKHTESSSANGTKRTVLLEKFETSKDDQYEFNTSYIYMNQLGLLECMHHGSSLEDQGLLRHRDRSADHVIASNCLRRQSFSRLNIMVHSTQCDPCGRRKHRMFVLYLVNVYIIFLRTSNLMINDVKSFQMRIVRVDRFTESLYSGNIHIRFAAVSRCIFCIFNGSLYFMYV